MNNAAAIKSLADNARVTLNVRIASPSGDRSVKETVVFAWGGPFGCVERSTGEVLYLIGTVGNLMSAPARAAFGAEDASEFAAWIDA